MRSFLFLIVLTVAGDLQARQVTGVISDAETGRPLAGAHVFIAGTLIGTAADEAGTFHLASVPPGRHRFVGTMLGYETSGVDTTFVGSLLHLELRLTPTVLEAGTIEVVARQDGRWQKNLERFTRQFLGASAAARAARIVNPEILDFDRAWWGRLRARASAPLVLEHDHLGYRTTYHLKEYDYTPSVLRYDGDPEFQELEPATPEQAADWRANRSAAFLGSYRHFLLSLLSDSLESQGFHLYRRPSLDRPTQSAYRFSTGPDRLISERDSAGVTLSFSGFVEIIFEPEMEEIAYLEELGTMRRPGPQVSWIKLNDGPTRIDWSGTAIDPYGITVYGYLAFERVGDELPKEYRPAGVHLKPR
ncbi:MAG: carboxypeptidase-like regulatory domain-containing protein [Rhodothermales bacterium]|nr:carboxypeptidase-like regulatory domain-containing protein [Rhodothermales bacterium]